MPSQPSMLTQSIVLADINTLTPHPSNPRHGDLDALRESIEANGFYGALVVQRSTGYILAGNHRYQAAQQLGLKQLPVTYLDVDDATALRILLVDNRSNDKAGYADQQLVRLLQDLNAGDLAGGGQPGNTTPGGPGAALRGSGYTPLALNDLLQTLKARDQAPPPRPAPTSESDPDTVWTPLRIPLPPALYQRHQSLMALAAAAGHQQPHQQFAAVLQAVSTTKLESLLRDLGVAGTGGLGARDGDPSPHAD